MSRRRLTAFFFLLITSIIWGVAGPVIKFTLTYFPPSIFLTYRFAISTVVGLILLAREKPKLPRNIDLVFLILVMALFTSTLRLGLLFVGFNETTSLSGSLISAMGPVVLVLTGHFLFKERISRMEKVGMSIAFIGTVISVAEPVFAASSAVFEATIKGNVIVFVSLLADIVSIILVKYLLKKGVSVSLLTHVSFIVGLVTLLPVALYQFDWHTVVSTIIHAPLAGHLGVWYMALLSGSLAYYLFNSAEKNVEVGEASLFTYLTPVWAAPLSLLWLGEKITGPFIASAVIIFIGVAIAEYHRRTR